MIKLLPRTKDFSFRKETCILSLFTLFFYINTFSQFTNTIYYENFDANNGSWVASNPGGNTFWTYGLNANISGGTEGNHWYTTNYNNYANNSHTYATSPVINLTGFNNLTFSIDIRYQTEASWDGMNIEYSDSGGIWTVLGAYSATPVNYWYNDTDVDGIGNNIDGWSGGNPGDNTAGGQSAFSDFCVASIALPASLNNKANVRFRVQFASDGSGTDNGANFDNVIIQGDYITSPSDPTYAPGAVTSNLKVWLKANSGTSTTTDGAVLSTWSDEAYDNDAIGITTNRPTYNNSAAENINFNPIINFGSTPDKHMKGKGGYYAQDYFLVIEPNAIFSAASSGQYIVSGKFSKENQGNDATGFNIGSGSARYNYTNDLASHSINHFPNGSGSGPNATSYGRTYAHASNTISGPMIINVKTNTANSSTEIYINGEQVDSNTGHSGNGSDLNFNEFDNLPYMLSVARITLNGHFANLHYTGKIGEFLSYSVKNSVADKQKVQSSLAIKYGITLHEGTQKTETDVNYVDSSGAIIWNAGTSAGYNYHIAGIGRDDAAELNQKQSKTENTADDITMGLTDIVATNSANANTFGTDNSYVVWGNNQASLLPAAPTNVDMSTGIGGLNTIVEFQSFNRIWKVKESGTVEKVKVSIPSSMLLPTLPSPGDYLMFISDTPVFAPDAEYRVMSVNGSNLETSYNFPSNGTKYVTFGYSPLEEFKRSIAFDGTDDFLIAYDVLDLHTTVSNPTGSFTLSAWIKKDANNGSIISKRNTGFTSGYDFSINGSANLVMSWINGGTRTVTSSATIPNNVWHNVAVIYDGTTATLYIDGVADTSANLITPLETIEDFRIATGGTAASYFDGNIDEVRVWDIALTEDQLRYIMNQEIDDNAGFVSGAYFNKGLEVPAFPHITGTSVVPTKNASIISWSNLQAYYPMSKYTYTNARDESGNGYTASLKQIITVDIQTAPIPYVSSANGNWTSTGTWQNGGVQTIPGATSIVDNTKTVGWNIVETNHNITMDNSLLPASTDDNDDGNRSLLALNVKGNEITVNGDNTSGTGGGLTITHYLKLDGVIDLEGESQLIQTDRSDLAVNSSGHIEKDQQGTANSFTYNYWSSPVSTIGTGANNVSHTVMDVLRDGTTSSTPVTLDFSPGATMAGSDAFYADGGLTNPRKIAKRWLWKFVPNGNAYANWLWTGNTNLNVTEGYSMKGVSGGSVITDTQNYTFIGKPNNVLNGATEIVHTTFPPAAGDPYVTLTGNPFPSAMDAEKFIQDNITSLDDSPTDGKIYFWEHWGGGTHNWAEYQGGYAIKNLTTGVTAVSHPSVDPGGSAAKGSPGQFIPPGQGFFVISSVAGGDVVFKNSQRVFKKESAGVSVFYKYSKEESKTIQNRKTENDKMIIRLGFKSPDGYHRQVAVGFNVANATDGYDHGYDATAGDWLTNDAFFLVDEYYYVIQAYGDFNIDREIPLSVFIGEDNDQGLETFMLDGLENVPDDVEVYIKDNDSGETHDIKNQEYEVNLATGEHKTRFSLVFKASSLSVDEANLVENGIDVFMNNTTSTIDITKTVEVDISKVTLFNYLGQTVQIWTKGLLNNELKLPVNKTSTGAYILKIETENKTVSKKLIIE